MSKHDFFQRCQVKSHQDGKWRNPYFRQTKKKRSRYKWPGLILGILALIGLVFFLFAPGYTINRVVVQGTEYIDPRNIEEVAWDELHNRRYLILPGTNRFLINEEAIGLALNDKFVFESLEISQEGSTLVVIVQERVSSLVWSTGERHYFVDNAGTITRELLPEEVESTVTNLPQIFDQSNAGLRIGNTVLNTDIIQATFDFLALAGQGGVEIEYLAVETEESEWMLAHVKEDYDILFDPTEDIARQVNNLFVIMKESVEDISKINYIDLRFGDHVYFK